MRRTKIAHNKFRRIIVAKDIINNRFPFHMNSIFDSEAEFKDVEREIKLMLIDALEEANDFGVLKEAVATLGLSSIVFIPGTPMFIIPKTKEVKKVLGRTMRKIKKGKRVKLEVVLGGDDIVVA